MILYVENVMKGWEFEPAPIESARRSSPIIQIKPWAPTSLFNRRPHPPLSRLSLAHLTFTFSPRERTGKVETTLGGQGADCPVRRMGAKVEKAELKHENVADDTNQRHL